MSFSEPKLFFIDPVLIAMALLYRRGWFATGSTRSAKAFFSRKNLVIPLLEDKGKMPIFATCTNQYGTRKGVDFTNPASTDAMCGRLKQEAIRACFLGMFYLTMMMLALIKPLLNHDITCRCR
jgi:hypothetical protein